MNIVVNVNICVRFVCTEKNEWNIFLTKRGFMDKSKLKFLLSGINVFIMIKKDKTGNNRKLRKNKSNLVKVYAVRDDKNGYPHFLIYENNSWKYVSAKHFIP